MPKATYYNELLVGKEFDVLKENKDGTLDIGIEKTGTLVVGSVRVVESAEVGCVTRGGLPAAARVDEDPEDDDNNPLDSKTKAELLELVNKFNSTAADDQKIALPTNASKSVIVEALTNAGVSE